MTSRIMNTLRCVPDQFCQPALIRSRKFCLFEMIPRYAAPRAARIMIHTPAIHKISGRMGIGRVNQVSKYPSIRKIKLITSANRRPKSRCVLPVSISSTLAAAFFPQASSDRILSHPPARSINPMPMDAIRIVFRTPWLISCPREGSKGMRIR